MKYLLMILVLIFSSNLVAADESYLCSTHETTGFYYESGRWQQVNFTNTDELFIIKRFNENDGSYFHAWGKDYPYGLYIVGSKHVERQCTVSKIPGYTDYIRCEGGGGEIKFAPSTGRFLQSVLIGYLDGAENNDYTPFIARGTCKRI